MREESTKKTGITRIYYKIPIFDGRNNSINGGKGNFVGYKDIKQPKTVYDPAKYSDKEMLDMAQQAAAKGYEEAMKSTRREYTYELKGIKFRVYLEENLKTRVKTGVIESVHPE